MTIDPPERELRYRRPSTDWLDALPLGNGRTGVMVQAAADRVHLHLNDVTGWSGGVGSAHRRGSVDPHVAARALDRAAELWQTGRIVEAEQALAALQQDYVQAFMPFADLVLRVGLDPALAVDRRLRLRDGEHVLTAGPAVQRTFASAIDGVVVHRLDSEVPLDVELLLSTPLGSPALSVAEDGASLLMALPADVAPGHEPDEPALTWNVDRVHPLSGAAAVRWTHDGTRIDTAGSVRWTGVRHLELRLTTGTDFDRIGREPLGAEVAHARVTEALDRIADHGWTKLRSRHLADHRGHLDRFSLDLGPSRDEDSDLRVLAADRHPDGALAADPDLLALLADYGRYLLLASSRPGGLPATLQGLWNDDPRPPWSSAYTLNINTEMNYWPAGPTALPETAGPLLDLAEALAERGSDTAARLYGARGWVAHHNTDAWANPLPTAGDASWALWPMGGIWLVRQLDELRRLDLVDDAWCARLWPLAVGAAEFGLDLLSEGPDGPATWPSTSPENRFVTEAGPASVTRGSAMDRALLHEVAATVRGLAGRLGLAHPVLVELDQVLPRIDGPRIAPDGTVQEWDSPRPETEPQHRHVSHLVFAYPGAGPAPEQVAAVAATLDRRGDDSTGWSVAWKSALWARVGDGERAGRVLALALRPAWDAEAGPHAGGVYRNLFAAHPPFQIDGNLGLTAAVAELLVSGVDGTVHLLPALPQALAAAGTVRGLVVHPGITVDMAWRDGVPTSVLLSAHSSRSSGPREVRWRDRRWLVELSAEQPLTLPI